MIQYKTALIIMSVICLVLSVIHIPWLWSFQEYAVINPISHEQLLSFQLLSTAVIMFLLFMGLTAFIIARAPDIKVETLRAITCLFLVFFICRLIVEFIFPLQIPLLGVNEPTTMVKLLFCPVILVLLAPFLGSSNKTSTTK